jgi:hypothetical protein
MTGLRRAACTGWEARLDPVVGSAKQRHGHRSDPRGQSRQGQLNEAPRAASVLLPSYMAEAVRDAATVLDAQRWAARSKGT